MTTFETLMRLYAPFAALLGVVFWLGVLSNRVATLERESRERKAAEEREGRDGKGVSDRLLVLETTYQLHSESTTNALAGINREIAGIHRMFANSIKGSGRRPVKEFNPADEDQA